MEAVDKFCSFVCTFGPMMNTGCRHAGVDSLMWGDVKKVLLLWLNSVVLPFTLSQLESYSWTWSSNYTIILPLYPKTFFKDWLSSLTVLQWKLQLHRHWLCGDCVASRQRWTNKPIYQRSPVTVSLRPCWGDKVTDFVWSHKMQGRLEVLSCTVGPPFW